jgi:hypothetical protein
MIEACVAPLPWETYFSKIDLSKIQNLDHKSKATRSQLPRKTNGAQPSIERRPIPLNDIGNQAWHLAKGPWKDSYDLGPIMSPHIYIIFSSKLAKKNKKEKKKILSVWDKEVDKLHMRKKCPK